MILSKPINVMNIGDKPRKKVTINKRKQLNDTIIIEVVTYLEPSSTYNLKRPCTLPHPIRKQNRVEITVTYSSLPNDSTDKIEIYKGNNINGDNLRKISLTA